LGQWVQDESAWLPAGSWAACADFDRTIPDRTPVVLGFDGSYRGDSTALIVCTIGDKPYLDVAALWETPHGAREDWSVPIVEVEEKIMDVARRWDVKEICADPFRWARSLQVLAAAGL